MSLVEVLYLVVVLYVERVGGGGATDDVGGGGGDTDVVGGGGDTTVVSILLPGGCVSDLLITTSVVMVLWEKMLFENTNVMMSGL